MNLDINAGGEDYKVNLPPFCGAHEYPMVFVGGEYVGGLAKTKELLKKETDIKAYILKKISPPEPTPIKAED